MKTSKKSRLLSAMLAILMVVTMFPVTVFAAEGDTVYTKVTSSDELTTGKYVMVASHGYAPTVYADGWLSTTAVAADGDNIVNPDKTLVWTVTVDGNTVKLTDSNGETVAPKGGNNNGIIKGDYSWNVAFNNGTFTFSGQGADTVILASNTQTGSTGGFNRFRAYKTKTVNGAPQTYPSEFTLYKLEGSSAPVEPEEPDVKEVTAAEFLAAAEDDTLYAVTGKITEVKNPTYRNFFFEDATASIYVYGNKDLPEVEVGDTVKVTGKRSSYKGDPQMSGIVSIEIIEKAPEEPDENTAEYTETVANGDKVIIFNGANGKAVGVEGYTYTNKSGKSKDELVAVDGTVDGTVLTYGEGTAIFEVSIDADGHYTFVSQDGKYFYLDGTNVRLVNEAGNYTLFDFEKVEDGYYVKSTNAVFGEKAQYLEYYGGYFTCYGMGNDTSIYTFQFYKVESGEDAPVEPEEPDENTAEYTETVANGDKVIIFNRANGKAVGVEGYTYTNKSGKSKDELVAVDGTVDGTVLTYGEGTAIFEVSIDADGHYTFVSQDGKYFYL
ncbi:MAG: hypothetical protein IJM98_10790, partial [Oscillospiraceae bacterium]|nr:hypothetical protein [Oscillospiraceae bacterium]